MRCLALERDDFVKLLGPQLIAHVQNNEPLPLHNNALEKETNNSSSAHRRQSTGFHHPTIATMANAMDTASGEGKQVLKSWHNK